MNEEKDKRKCESCNNNCNDLELRGNGAECCKCLDREFYLFCKACKAKTEIKGRIRSIFLGGPRR